MKKTVTLFILLVSSLFTASAQFSGNGEPGSPYSGTMTGSVTFSGTRYIGTLTVGSGVLTLAPGTILIATSSTSEIKISGSGQLIAIGTSSERILFTSDSDNNGTPGEPGDIWGGISITSSDSSIIEYCTIENGLKDTPRRAGYGGGLQIGSSKVRVTNCTIRNSRATYGGAISIAAGITPEISNCLITGNSALKQGGGMYITGSASPKISHCTITANSTEEQGGGIYITTGSTAELSHCTISGNSADLQGGGIYITGGSSPQISNCTITDNSADLQGGGLSITADSYSVISGTVFANNTSLSTENRGGTIAITGGSSAHIVNSVIAYSISPAADGKSIYIENSPDTKVINTIIWGGSDHIGLSGTPSPLFDHCAIEGTSLTGCLTLNSSNTAPDGPNFTNPENGDFTLAFESPCRDSGTDSHPGVAIPAEDPLQTKRIWVTDIGAYEVKYSRWLGTSGGWARSRSWDKAVTPGSTNILIPSGLAQYPDATSNVNFILNEGLKMIVEPGARVTFTTLTNNGTIYLHADATGTASLITNSYSGLSGNINVDLHLTADPAGGDWWHYITPPTTLSKSVITDVEPEMLVRYDENMVVTDVSDGWQWHDGYGGTTPFSQLNAWEGYDVSLATDATITFSNLKSLTTTPGRINLPFSGSGGDTTIFGYSLLGNSLTCGINWNNVIWSDGHNLIRHAYYVRTANGGEASYVDGVSTNGATAHVAPLQGFFVRTRAVNTWLEIPDNAREHNQTPRFKSAQEKHIMRLTLSSPTMHDETVIRFTERATWGFDEELDAGKPFMRDRSGLKIFSELNGESYSINSVPPPDRKREIPLTLVIPSTGTHRITVGEIPSARDVRIVLTDRLTGSRCDLLTTREYSFPAPAGTIEGRFTLEITPVIKRTALTEEISPQESAESSLKIYSASGSVFIMPQGTVWNGVTARVRIVDITGRVLLTANEEYFNQGELKEYHISDGGGLLIVEVITGSVRQLEKVVLKK